MSQSFSSNESPTKPLAPVLLVVLLFAFLGAMYFSAHMQNAMELTPQHPDAIQYCLCVGLVAAVGCATLMGLQTSGDEFLRKMLVAAALVLGFAAAFEVALAVSNVEQMRADFPTDKIQAYSAQWPVVEAFRVQSRKGPTSYSIKTTVFGGSLDIHAQDFVFMRDNVAPEDIGSNGSPIQSRGRFCANVNLQRAGEAIRLMVGPGQPLPAGSIGLCSQSLAN